MSGSSESCGINDDSGSIKSSRDKSGGSKSGSRKGGISKSSRSTGDRKLMAVVVEVAAVTVAGISCGDNSGSSRQEQSIL